MNLTFENQMPRMSELAQFKILSISGVICNFFLKSHIQVRLKIEICFQVSKINVSLRLFFYLFLFKFKDNP